VVAGRGTGEGGCSIGAVDPFASLVDNPYGDAARAIDQEIAELRYAIHLTPHTPASSQRAITKGLKLLRNPDGSVVEIGKAAQPKTKKKKSKKKKVKGDAGGNGGTPLGFEAFFGPDGVNPKKVAKRAKRIEKLSRPTPQQRSAELALEIIVDAAKQRRERQERQASAGGAAMLTKSINLSADERAMYEEQLTDPSPQVRDEAFRKLHGFSAEGDQ
jgi:hypothetical protein